jgi:hypothetical protein
MDDFLDVIQAAENWYGIWNFECPDTTWGRLKTPEVTVLI